MAKQQFTAQDITNINNYNKAVTAAVVEGVKKMVVEEQLLNNTKQPAAKKEYSPLAAQAIASCRRAALSSLNEFL